MLRRLWIVYSLFTVLIVAAITVNKMPNWNEVYGSWVDAYFRAWDPEKPNIFREAVASLTEREILERIWNMSCIERFERGRSARTWRVTLSDKSEVNVTLSEILDASMDVADDWWYKERLLRDQIGRQKGLNLRASIPDQWSIDVRHRRLVVETSRARRRTMLNGASFGLAAVFSPVLALWAIRFVRFGRITPPRPVAAQQQE